MTEAIDRRSFVRRIFAMGAGIAASGALVRAADAAAKLAPSKDAFEAMLTWYGRVDRGRSYGIITNLDETTATISPPLPSGATTVRGVGSRDGLRVGDRIEWSNQASLDDWTPRNDGVIQVETLEPMEFPNPERLAEDFLNYQFENFGGKEAIAAAMRDDMLYGAHGRIVVGKDLYARYEPLPIVASSRLVEPASWRGRSIMSDLLKLNG